MKEWADAIDRVIESIKTGDWTASLSWLEALKTAYESLDKDRFTFAKNILEHEIKKIAFDVSSEVARQWRAGEFNGDRDMVQQSIDESCESACAHTFRAQLILAFSRYDDAYLEEMGELSLSHADNMPWAAMAMVALRWEVMDCLRREPGVDLDEDPPEVPLVDCGSCGDWKPGKDGVCDECRNEDEEKGND